MFFAIFVSFLAIAAGLIFAYRWLRIRYLGTLDTITTGSIAYDEATFGHILNWDKYCFYINGKPIMLISGEFHYWRVPDKERWKQVLLQYKASGLNCIRIYFCWAYHSPDDGVYHFDGNRDIDYLLSLCEELEIFVLAAPGPYICAETQAGGHPAWLVAKTNVRLRHSVTTFVRTFDEEYSKYCIQYFNAILPIIARHQITVKPNGCVLALQIENEAFELFKGFPVGLSDDMRILSKAARDLGMNVPLFTNDAWEEGSFVARSDSHRVMGAKTFGLDLYGFDKYVVFCPTSNPLASVVSGNNDMTTWKEWDPKNVIDAFDKTESTIRSFGGGAAASPIIIPELQGDDVYNYYGKDFTKMVTETAMGQGSTAFSLYMFYGGTNWGTLGDPDVYTSYDYSACLREFGHLCEKTRLARLGFSFARSFADIFLKTDANDIPVRSSFILNSSVQNFISKKRVSIGPAAVHFIFYRNFSDLKATSSSITLQRTQREPLVLNCRLGYKESFIGLGNYKTANNLHLILSTLPIHLRALSPDGHEIWFIQSDDDKDGQLAFQGGIEIEKGSLEPVSIKEDDVSIVSFKNMNGWCKIQQVGEPSTSLLIVALTGVDLLSLHPIFREGFWGGASNSYPEAVFWGAYQINFDFEKRELTTLRGRGSTRIRGISSNLGPLKGFSDTPDYPSPVQEFTLPSTFIDPPAIPKIAFEYSKRLDLKKLDFIPLELKPSSTRPVSTPIELCYISGLTVYKLVFNLDSLPSGKGLPFNYNMRHRCAVLLNNKSLGGHMNYELSSYKAGSKNGPDIGNWFGWANVMLPTSELKVGENEIFCIVESLGMNRAPGPIDDIRSPRGLMDANVKGVKSLAWYISGVDVRKLDQIYNSTGIPHESQPFVKLPTTVRTIPKDSVVPTFYKGKFEYGLNQDVISPLRLSVHGNSMAYIFVNGLFIARYYGRKQSPQNDFYIPEKLLLNSNSIEVMTFGVGDDVSLEMEFKQWTFESDPTLISGSGNLKNGASPFILNLSTAKI